MENKRKTSKQLKLQCQFLNEYFALKLSKLSKQIKASATDELVM